MLKTNIIKPGFLEVGFDLITDFERHEKDGKEWYFIYSIWEGYMGFAEDLRVQSEKLYLEGTVEGINQQIKLEILDIERVEELIPLYHELMGKYIKAVKGHLSALVLLKLGEQF